jgi:hypothetical protein
MGYKLKYLALIFFIKTSVIAQKTDSSMFKLKPFFIGIELGRSPYRLNKSDGYFNTEINSKILPYFSFMFGYNLRLIKYSYIIPKLGYISEFSNYNSTYKTIESFNGVNTTGTQTVSFVGYKTSNYNQSLLSH